MKLVLFNLLSSSVRNCFSSYCISQIWSSVFLQSFWHYIWPDFYISWTLLKFYLQGHTTWAAVGHKERSQEGQNPHHDHPDNVQGGGGGVLCLDGPRLWWKTQLWGVYGRGDRNAKWKYRNAKLKSDQHNLRSYRWPQQILQSYRLTRFYKFSRQKCRIYENLFYR